MKNCNWPGQGGMVCMGSINQTSWEIDMNAGGSEESPVALLCCAHSCLCWMERERRPPLSLHLFFHI